MTANASLFSQMKPTFPDGGYKSFPKMGSVKFFCTFIRRHIDKSDNTMYTYYKYIWIKSDSSSGILYEIRICNQVFFRT